MLDDVADIGPLSQTNELDIPCLAPHPVQAYKTFRPAVTPVATVIGH